MANFNQVFKLALTVPVSFTASSLEWCFGWWKPVVPHRLLATSITSTTQNLPTAQSNINKLLAVNESTEILNGFIKFVFFAIHYASTTFCLYSQRCKKPKLD